MPVAWFTREPLTAAIGRASVDRSINKVIARITRAVLIVVDDIGILPTGQAWGHDQIEEHPWECVELLRQDLYQESEDA